MFKSFKDMPVWPEAMSIAEKVFNLTENLPKKEDYGFTSQIRKAALSISANIAEAYGRNRSMDKVNFYYFARGSITETQSHLEYGRRVGYFNNDISTANVDESLSNLLNDVNKIIVSLKSSKSLS